MVHTSYEQENKVCHQVRESFTYYFSHKAFLVCESIKQKNVLCNSNNLLGRYSGHFWQNFGFWELDARVELILRTNEG